MNSDSSEPTRFLKAREVIKLASFSRVTLWRQVKSGSFPAPVKVSQKGLAWRLSDFERWAADPEGWAEKSTV